MRVLCLMAALALVASVCDASVPKAILAESFTATW